MRIFQHVSLWPITANRGYEMYSGPYALEHQLIKVIDTQNWKQFLFE